MTSPRGRAPAKSGRARRGGAALLVATATALGASGCGGGEPAPSPEAQVRAKLAQFSRATRDKDYRALCGEIYSASITRRTEAIGLPCPVALRQALGEVSEPELTVGDVRVAGADASAQVRTSARGQAPSRDTIRLRREGDGWRIVELAGS